LVVLVQGRAGLVHSFIVTLSNIGVDQFTARWDDGDAAAIVVCVALSLLVLLLLLCLSITRLALVLPLLAQLVSIQPQGTWVLTCHVHVFLLQ
jgi:hypothetical protein